MQFAYTLRGFKIKQKLKFVEFETCFALLSRDSELFFYLFCSFRTIAHIGYQLLPLPFILHLHTTLKYAAKVFHILL